VATITLGLTVTMDRQFQVALPILMSAEWHEAYLDDAPISCRQVPIAQLRAACRWHRPEMMISHWRWRGCWAWSR